MVASSDPHWIQGDLSTLVGLFDRVGLRNNAKKTVGMDFYPCQAAGTQLKAAYMRRMTGEGPSYRERQMGWFQCKEYGEEMTLGSLAGHIQTQNGRAAEGRRSWEATTPREEPMPYIMDFLNAGVNRNFPVEVCTGRATTRTSVQVHFFHRHVRDTVISL